MLGAIFYIIQCKEVVSDANVNTLFAACRLTAMHCLSMNRTSTDTQDAIDDAQSTMEELLGLLEESEKAVLPGNTTLQSNETPGVTSVSAC